MARPGRNPQRGRVLIALAEDGALNAARWLLTDGDGRLLQQGRASLEAPAPPPADRVVLFAPGQDMLVRRLVLSDIRPAAARAEALRRLQGESLIAGADAPHVVLGPADMEGGRWLAAIRPALLDAWRSAAEGLGLKPDVILPDSLAPPPSDADWTALPLEGRVALRRADAAVTVEPDLAEVLTQGATVVVLDQAGQVDAALIATALAPPLNLLDGLTDRAGPRRWLWVAGMAAALAVSPLVLIGAEAVRLDLAAGALDRRSREAVQAAWPDAPPGVDPRAEARRRLGPAGPAGGFAGASAALFAAIEDLDGAQLQALSLDGDGDGALRATLAHGDYGDVARIDAALQPFGLSAVEDSVGDEGGRVISDIRVSVR